MIVTLIKKQRHSRSELRTLTVPSDLLLDVVRLTNVLTYLLT